MTIVGMDDLAAVSMSQVGVVTWETAADWDGAVEWKAVAHDSFGDLPGGDTVQVGYGMDPLADASAHHMWPSDEDSGTTLADPIGGQNATLTGGVVGKVAAFGTTAVDYDGTDDYANAGDGANIIPFAQGSSVSWWQKYEGGASGTEKTTTFSWQESDNTANRYLFHGPYQGNWYLDLGSATAGAGRITGTWDGASWDNAWTFFTGVTDATNDEMALYANGALVKSVAGAYNPPTSVTGNPFHLSRSGAVYFGGGVEALTVWNRPLTLTEHQYLYGLHGTNVPYLTTATKSFSTAGTPDFTDLVYSLNGGSITLTAIGSPGTASEETHSVTLDGTQTSAALTWTNSHTDFRTTLALSPTAVGDNPTVGSVTLRG